MYKSITTDHYTCEKYTGEIVLSLHIAQSYVENVRFSDGCYQPNRPRITADPRQ